MLSGYATWAALIFIVIVLIEVVRAGFLLVRNLEGQLKIDTDTDVELPDNPPLVSVIVPAKDEEDCIEQCIGSVLASTYPRLEMVVVNDRSSDRTAEILERAASRDRRIRVVTVEELPPQWTGKTHALYRGAESAAGSVLLFSDADTEFDPEAISRSLAFMIRNDLDMLSLLPGFINSGFKEKAISPHLALGISTFYPLSRVNDPSDSAGLASGSFIMIERSVYDTIGGWGRFRDEITEDVALSKVLKAGGFAVNLIRGANLVRTRGFDGFADLCQFWVRTFYGGLEKSIGRTARLIMNYVGPLGAYLVLLLSAAAYAAGRSDWLLELVLILSAIVCALVMAAYTYFLYDEHGRWEYGLTTPVGLIAGAWVSLRTLATVISGKGVQWRGSRYT